jgi:hypothetical protein
MSVSSKTHPAPGEAPTQEQSQDVSTASPTPATNLSTPTAVPVNPPGSKFDPKNYRQTHNVRLEESAVLTRKLQTIIPVRKPNKKQFVCVHPSLEFRAENMPTIEDETTGEIYLLAANLEFPVDVENKVDFLNLAAAITTDGSLFSGSIRTALTPGATPPASPSVKHPVVGSASLLTRAATVIFWKRR